MKKTKNSANKNKGKSAYLSTRLTQTEKRQLEKKAAKSGMNLSNYARTLLFERNENQQNLELMNQCVTLCQDILNIAQEKYSCEDNSLLEEKVKKLWKVLSSSV